MQKIETPQLTKRQEIVKIATEAGIAKASNLKTTVLEDMLKEMHGPISNEPIVETRGRKVNMNSARQIRLVAKANGEIGQRGRKPNETSARQQRLAKWEEMKAQGGEIKRGRPAGSGKPKVDKPAKVKGERKGSIKPSNPDNAFNAMMKMSLESGDINANIEERQFVKPAKKEKNPLLG
jgi:hypothetical protein